MWIEDCYNAIKLRIVQLYQYTDNTFNPPLSPFTPAVSSGDFQDNTKDKAQHKAAKTHRRLTVQL